MRRAAAVLAGAALAAAPAALAAASAHVPAKDAFKGTIGAGTGAFRLASGSVSLAIHVKGDSASARPATIVVHGKACGRKAHCIRLHGRLHGSLRPGAQQIPDTGSEVDFSGHGTIGPIGHVTADGTIHGTGFIREAHETITLTLDAGRGSVTVSGQSGLVPGNTTP